MELCIGISGWRYAGWRGDFYPAGLAQRRELEYASRALTSIEINGSFYSLQRPSSYRRWRAETPDGFVFAVKGPRFVTHMKKLVGVDAALGNFVASGVLALGPRLGPILWQLPATFRFDATRMADFFALLPRSTTEQPGWGRSTTTSSPTTACSWTSTRTGCCGTASRCGIRASTPPRRTSSCAHTTSAVWSLIRPESSRCSPR